MPEKKTVDRARRDKRQGKAPTTQAGGVVRGGEGDGKGGKQRGGRPPPGGAPRGPQARPGGGGS